MIADSSAWIDMLRGPASEVGRRLEQALRQGEPLLMPDVVYQEILQGASSARHFVNLQAELDTVPSYLCQTIPTKPPARRPCYTPAAAGRA
jgi:predicted nucleic acid-binding protein